MRRLLWSLILIACLGGCSTFVVYDEYIDSFRYKPESNFEYVQHLGPKDCPVNPNLQNK